MARREPVEKKTTMADKADKHILYQESVQCVEAEIDFVDSVYKKLNRRRAKVLREDFCGTANTACEWIRRRKTNQAFGVDLDEKVLAWGEQYNVSRLGTGKQRISLIAEDVMTVETSPPDLVIAMNFSYWSFKERLLLRRYFKEVQNALAKDGLFVIDCYGGSEAFEVTKDRHKYKGFTYIWHQAAYNPITGEMRANIHFKFPDGSKLKKAFTYEWRLWTLPELQEILTEAGFSRSTVYWQGTDKDGEGDGEFEPSTVGEPDAAWIAYLVAEK